MDLELVGKRVLVTGASRGIGRAIAAAFAGEGATVVVNARDIARLNDAAVSMKNAIPVAGDVSDTAVARSVLNRSIDALGGLDVVVCNVGDGTPVTEGIETRAQFEEVFQTNLWSVVNTVEAAAEALEASRGNIVCVTSICGIERVPGAPVAYSVAKAAVTAYISAASDRFAQRGIRIVGIAPGNVLVDGGRWAQRIDAEPETTASAIKQAVPLQRLASPAEIADLVLVAASDRSAFATGTTWIIDGGQTRSAH